MRCTASVLALVATCAIAQRAAAGEAALGLLSDVERIVSAQESDAWFLDDEAYAEIRAVMLESVCRAPAAERQVALVALHGEAVATGDPRQLYLQHGRTLTREVKAALHAQRKLRALEMAVAEADESCPFWIESDPGFLGRQTDRKRFTLSIESGGLAQLRETAATWTLGGGGYARVLPGYGFGDVSLLAGIEFGGGAMLRPNTSPTEFVINYFPAIPVMVRFHDVAWHYDVEAGPIGLFQADDANLSYGARVGFAVGIFALKVRGVLPWVGAATAYDHYVPSGGRPRAHFIRAGFRAGVVWDP
jgi:hypothetical protein